MNHNFIRPGGVAADLPDGWQHDVLELCDQVEQGVAEYDTLLSENPIWRERTVGVGVITTAAGARARRHRPDPPLHRLRVGPAQGAAVPRVRRRRLRRDLHRERRRLRPLPDPPLRDPRVDQDRAPVRGEDARRRLPRAGPQGHAAAACAHRRVDGSADPPLQALHRGLPRARGRDLRRRRVAPRRDRVLSRVRRHREARRGCTSAGRRSTTCSRWTRWCPAGCSPTRWRSSRASIRSWGRSTASAVHACEPRPRARDHRAVPAEEVGGAAVAAPRAGPGRSGHARRDRGDRRPPRPHARGRARDVLLLHDVQAGAGGEAARVGVHQRELPGQRRPRPPRPPRAPLRGRRRRHRRRGRVHRRVRPRAGRSRSTTSSTDRSPAPTPRR